MPYYTWKGVTLTGVIRKGTIFARSEADLDKQLFDRDIALLKSRTTKRRWWQRLSSDAHFKIQFFRQLAALLSAGIFLAEALTLMSQQMNSKPQLQEVIIGLVDKVQQGISLGIALTEYPHIFDKLIIQMSHVGGDTGALAHALDVLCDDLEMKRDIRARIRSAALLPSFTFLFFMFVATVLVLFVIPRFTGIFSLYGIDVPVATKKLLAISDTLRNWLLPTIVIGGVGCIVLIRSFAISHRGRLVVDPILLRLPLIGKNIRLYAVASTMRAVAMLITHGMPLVTALRTVSDNINNTVVQRQYLYIQQHIIAGSSMSQAMRQMHDSIFDQDLITAVRIGEESGNLSIMLTQISTIYYEKVKRDLLYVTTFLNPCLTIILGLLITTLIIAIYLPIFSLSHVIGQ